MALVHLAWWIAAAVILLLVVVVVSYRQTCYDYPSGGVAYAVSKANLGQNASLVAASGPLVDYVLTVAVSVVAGMANIVSAFTVLAPHAVALSIGLVVVLAVMNLRGVKESGTGLRDSDVCVRRERVPNAGVGGGAAAGRTPASGSGVGVVPNRLDDARDRSAGGGAAAASVRAGLHVADRDRGGEQRGAELPEAEEPERGEHARSWAA
ncbi:MAG: APC family permease [Pseudonocardia sp.]|nr:APC family permease [Pseudonocardia sp.]